MDSWPLFTVRGKPSIKPLQRPADWASLTGFLGMRPEGFWLKRPVAFFKESFKSTFFLRLFVALVELLAFGEPGHGGQFGIQRPGFAQAHHF